MSIVHTFRRWSSDIGIDPTTALLAVGRIGVSAVLVSIDSNLVAMGEVMSCVCRPPVLPQR